MEAIPKISPQLAAENTKDDRNFQIFEDIMDEDYSSYETDHEIIDLDSEEEEHEKLGFLGRVIKSKKTEEDFPMEYVVDEKKEGFYFIRRRYTLRSCNDICKILKKGGEKEEKGKVVIEGKGKVVIVDKEKALTVEGGRRIVVCGLAVGQQVKKTVGKRKVRCSC